jgi:hypothetical protein
VNSRENGEPASTDTPQDQGALTVDNNTAWQPLLLDQSQPPAIQAAAWAKQRREQKQPRLDGVCGSRTVLRQQPERSSKFVASVSWLPVCPVGAMVGRNPIRTALGKAVGQKDTSQLVTTWRLTLASIFHRSYTSRASKPSLISSINLNHDAILNDDRHLSESKPTQG